jgi:hypothetical protein
VERTRFAYDVALYLTFRNVAVEGEGQNGHRVAAEANVG